MTDNSQNLDPVDQASMEAAQRNAGGYPTTSGDLDQFGPEGRTGTADDPELDQAMQSVEGVKTYLDPSLDSAELTRRADLVEQAETARDGDNRKGVDAAIADARGAA